MLLVIFFQNIFYSSEDFKYDLIAYTSSILVLIWVFMICMTSPINNVEERISTYEKKYIKIKCIELYKKIKSEMVSEGTIDSSLNCRAKILHCLFDEFNLSSVMEKISMPESDINETINLKFGDIIRFLLKSEQKEFISKQELVNLVTYVRNWMVRKEILSPDLNIDNIDDLFHNAMPVFEETKIIIIYDAFMKLQLRENEYKYEIASKIYKSYMLEKSIPRID